MARIIVTSALPYAYSIPHLGNFVGSVLPADVYYKYLKMKGEDAIFICGSDQHGTPTELAAIKAGVEPEALANEMHEKIKRLFERYGCTFTHYGKTHTPENKEVVYSIFNELYNNGYLLEREDLQAYCNVDKRFLTDRLIQGTCPYCHKRDARGDQCNNCDRLLEPTQIVDPFCAICGKSDIIFVKTKNLALELGKLQDEIVKFIKKNSKNNWSRDAINKSLSMIKEGLKPRDITRNLRWGFPVPLVGYENAVIYVWVTGLIGYIGITKEWDSRRWRDYWQNEHTRLVQFLGKDNTIFHTIIWPAMAIGSRLGFILPYTIKESQFLISKTLKFSKSRGVGLNLKTALEILPADYWRFVLMAAAPENSDTEFTKETLTETVNTVMNDKIGNLAQRVLKLAKTNRELIKGGVRLGEEKRTEQILEKYNAAFEKIELRKALNAVVQLANLGNEIMSRKEPWLLVKKDAGEFTKVFSSLIAITYSLAIALYPFTPKASKTLLSYFGIKSDPTLKLLDEPINIDFAQEPKPLFQKITKKEIDRLQRFQ